MGPFCFVSFRATTREIPSGQDKLIIPSRVANQNSGFTSSCRLTEPARIINLKYTWPLGDTKFLISSRKHFTFYSFTSLRSHLKDFFNSSTLKKEFRIFARPQNFVQITPQCSIVLNRKQYHK